MVTLHEMHLHALHPTVCRLTRLAVTGTLLAQPLTLPATGLATRAGSIDSGRAERSGTEEPSNLSSHDDEEGVEEDSQRGFAPRRRRRNLLPKVKSGQRCGVCHTCRNPQLKKACETRRAEQIKDLDARGELPVLLLPQLGGPSRAQDPRTSSVARPAAVATAAGAPPAASATSAADDPFTTELKAILGGRNGGVVNRMFASRLGRLLQGASKLEQRLVGLAVLGNSARDVQAALVRDTALSTLGEWLVEARDGSSAKLKLAQAVLDRLAALPIGLAALRNSGIGKIINRLGKAGPPELQAPAKELVAQWKQLVDQADLPQEAAAAIAKRDRLLARWLPFIASLHAIHVCNQLKPHLMMPQSKEGVSDLIAALETG